MVDHDHADILTRDASDRLPVTLENKLIELDG
jgi:hypothetical protein